MQAHKIQRATRQTRVLHVKGAEERILASIATVELYLAECQIAEQAWIDGALRAERIW